LFLDIPAFAASARRGFLIVLTGALLGVLSNALSPRGLGLLGPVPRPDTKGIEEVGLDEVWVLHRERKAIFVDARSAEEFAAGHIPGALLLPKEDFEEALSSWTTLIPFDTLLVTYCGGGSCETSRDVAELLKEEGYTQVKVFWGGWEKWREAGYPAEGDSPKGKKTKGGGQTSSSRSDTGPDGG
jgi:rhodanese-related sulfurtransferase